MSSFLSCPFHKILTSFTKLNKKLNQSLTQNQISLFYFTCNFNEFSKLKLNGILYFPPLEILNGCHQLPSTKHDMYFYTNVERSLSSTTPNLINSLVITALVLCRRAAAQSTNFFFFLSHTPLRDWHLFQHLPQTHSREGILAAEESRAAARQFTQRHLERSGRLCSSPRAYAAEQRSRTDLHANRTLDESRPTLCALVKFICFRIPNP